WRGGKVGEPKLLAEAYRNSLELALRNGLKRISFPSISTGAYGYPIEEAARIALRTVKEFLEERDLIEEVNFVLFTDVDFKVYSQAMVEIFEHK
ncbi:MAG: macro domain-containing protein, partial [Candidatus Bathyarchaeia archaeon]